MYQATYEKPPKTTPYLWPKKVETYSLSNVVALNLEEKVSYITYITLPWSTIIKTKQKGT